MDKNNEITIDLNVNKEQLEETADTLERISDAMPNIVIRNNQNVNLTLNNFIENKEKEGKNND